MIPKIIHYCWFGGNPLPELAVKCIESWQKFFPEYEIREWNETNFDVHACDYVREAYEEKRWAFVSDYARFWILYHHGGIYFDTDVEVIKSMEEILKDGSFMGCELGYGCEVNPGLGMGAVPKLELYREILEQYEKMHFRCKDGSYNEQTVVTHVSNILRKHGFQGNGEIEKMCDVTVYPPEYFCPMNYLDGQLIITDKTYSIHYYTGAWLSDIEKKVLKIGQKYSNKGFWGYLRKQMICLPLLMVDKTRKYGLINALKLAWKRIVTETKKAVKKRFGCR